MNAARRPGWFRDIWLDILYGIRMLRKSPAATAVAVASLAIGIGANTGIFSILNGLWSPLPVTDPDRIVVLAADTKGDETGLRYRFSYAALEDFRRHATPFSDVFGWEIGIRGLSTGSRSVQFFYSVVSGNYFSALGVQPAIGRVFQPGEGESATAPLNVVLGYSFWQKQFGGDPAVIGRQVHIDGRPATVIGVAPKQFHGLYSVADMDGYLPLSSLTNGDAFRDREVFSRRDRRSLVLVGRLKPDVGLEQAQTFMNVLARRSEQQYPDTDTGIGIRVVPEILARPLPLRFLVNVPLIRFSLLLLATLVLILACMNVANILLVRATVRQREMAIRAALGSGRARLIRQMLAESTLLVLLGAAAGTVLGQWSSHIFAGSIHLPTDLPYVLDFRFDWRVFSYSLAAALFASLFIGVWPAVRASQADAGAALHDGSRNNSGGRDRQRVRALLVIGQVAGSLVLLIGAALFVRSLRAVERVDLGFAPDQLFTARLNPRWAGYDDPRTKDFYRELKRRVEAWPGVGSASLAFSTPMGMYGIGLAVEVKERPVPPDQQIPVIGCNYVDTNYFATMGIPILRGRTFRESDNEAAPRVAIINQTMAKRFWPHQDAIGKHFHAGPSEAPPTEVIGVARDGKYLAIFESPLLYFYLPDTQYFNTMRVLHIRSSLAPESLRSRVEREVQTLDPNMPVADLRTMARILDGPQGLLIFRIGTLQAATMGVLGLVLALVGVYGIVSYGAAQRTREIGIRMALGATPQAVLRIILRQGVWLVLTGVGVGLLGAAALTRVLRRFLVQVSAVDPLTYATVSVLLAAIVLFACYLPARRAMRVDPMAALRHE
ncbi:MAG TPA: ABC transporter permease [Bryobacteraceae bacterium]